MPSPLVGLDGHPQQQPLLQVVRCHGITDCDELAAAAAAANAFLDLEAEPAPRALYRSLVSLERDKTAAGQLQGDWMLTYIEVRKA